MASAMDMLGDIECRFCFKRCERRDYTRTSNFRDMYKKAGGVVKRAEKEDTIELALPDAFGLDSVDSPRADATWENEARLRYAQLDPTCVRFLGLHRILNSSLRDPLQNWALVAIGTRSNPFPDSWSASGAFCEEHLEKACAPLVEGSDKFRSVDQFHSFSCESCFKKGTPHSATNVHKLISKRAALKLFLRDEHHTPEKERCSYLEQNFFFRWKCTPFTDSPAPTEKPKTGSLENGGFLGCARPSEIVMNAQNWMNSILGRARDVCKSSQDLKGHAFPESTSVVERAIRKLNEQYQGKPPPYLNPDFQETLKKVFQLAIEEGTATSVPHRKALAELHADIISTDLAQFCKNDQNHHCLRLDQLKSGSGFYECVATSKQILLDSSQAQIRIEKFPKLRAIFTDDSGGQLLPPIELLGISDSWLYAEGDPYFRCNGCVCETVSDRKVVIIEKDPEAAQTDPNKKFYKFDKWKNMQVIATINGDPFSCKIEEVISEFKVRLDRAIPHPEDSKKLTLFIEYPLHILAEDLRVKIDMNDGDAKTHIPILQVLRGGDYAMSQDLPIPPPQLYSISAIFSQKPNDSPSVRQYWKFRIASNLAGGPAFHHFWENSGNSPTLTQPWKSSTFIPKGNNFCIVPPLGNCTFMKEDDDCCEVGKCYYYFDPDRCIRHCKLDSCRVCSVVAPTAPPSWVQARRDLCDFIPLVDCVTDAGQAKWGLHFELESIVSPSHEFPPQGGVMFVSMPANLGKVQNNPPKVLGFVGTSSPVLSIDIIDRNFANKKSFINGFRETFESLLISCLDGRICVVSCPRVPTFESFPSGSIPASVVPAAPFLPVAAAPLPAPQKGADELKSFETLRSYLKEQLQDSSQQHALFNGCVIDYLLRVDFGAPVTLKGAICPKVGTPSSRFPPGIADVFVKYLEHCLPKTTEQKYFLSQCQLMVASHKKSSLEQLLLRKVVLIVMNENAKEKVKKGKQAAAHPLCGVLYNAHSQVDSKIAKVFFECYLEILQLQQAKASMRGLGSVPAITAVNYHRYIRSFLIDNPYRSNMEEMKRTLLAVRNKVAVSLGYPNSVVELSRADLYFLQSIRDEFSPLQCPTVSPQMMLELLTPVTGLRRLHAHARSVHFLGSGEDGSFHILALMQRNGGGTSFVSYLNWYSLRIPELQHRPGPDFLTAWMPQHSSFIKIRTHTQATGQIQTECPHGLYTGDLVRFRDSSNSVQNLPVCKVDVVENPYLFKVTDTTTSAVPAVSIVSGSFVQLQPRFFPFEKLDQEQQCLDPLDPSTGSASNIKFLLFRKLLAPAPAPAPIGCEAAWIKQESNNFYISLYTWSLPLRHTDRIDPAARARQNRRSPDELSVECACFLPCQTAMIALGCRKQSSPSFAFTSELYIFEEFPAVAAGGVPNHFLKVVVQGTLPTFTSLSLLSTDDGSVDNFVLVAATKVTQVNESAFFLHVTKEGGVYKVKCFRSINEIKAIGASSKKPVAASALRATHPAFKSTDVMPIRSKPHNFTDSWLHFRDLSLQHCVANVRDTNAPLILAKVNNGAPSTLADRKQLLNILKAEHNFIEFSDRALPIQFHKAYSIELDPTDPKRETAQFYVCTNGPKGKCIVSALPPRSYEFQAAVPSDLDGEYGHESGIAKFVFLLDAPSVARFGRTGGDQFREKTRLFAVPLRSWFPRLVQGKFGNNLQ